MTETAPAPVPAAKLTRRSRANAGPRDAGVTLRYERNGVYRVIRFDTGVRATNGHAALDYEFFGDCKLLGLAPEGAVPDAVVTAYRSRLTHRTVPLHKNQMLPRFDDPTTFA